ncbi:MAG: bifunctional phosphoribosyl-AMP cyclohydrolase/phosphoribosyl-ATP diphosphatase HisIE [Aridibacter famidurans]|nr:bifunctional phosphoribosyl-AMP cyclohydrolase/phosphoribosyl-ATP diphosphatase HisIE [Aridibacter famidurans]
MKVDFEKYSDGLMPAIVQDAVTLRVLTFGFMDKRALKKTRKKGVVTFFNVADENASSAGNGTGAVLKVKEILTDCDGGSILIKAYPKGKVCHLGKSTCFAEKNKPEMFLHELENVIHKRKDKPSKSSRTARLFNRGHMQIAKKFGEEAVELVIEGVNSDDELFLGEAADVLYHYLVLLADRDIRLDEVIEVLRQRRRK